MYTERNFRTKKAFKEAVAAFNSGEGNPVRVYDNSVFSVPVPENGTVCVEGPHSPEPHRWYAKAKLKDGVVVKVS